MSGLSILVVDDNRSAALAITMLLEREGHRAQAVYDGQSAIQHLRTEPCDLVLTDLRMEPVDGLAVVSAARQQTPPVEAIVFTAFGSVDVAVEAMRLGATDFLTKPVTADVILRRVNTLRHDATLSPTDIVGSSDASQQLRAQLTKLAQVNSTVLITGEIGVGRKHIARWLHQNGPMSKRPLLLVRPNQSLPHEQLSAAGTLLIPDVDRWDHRAQDLLQQQLELLEPGNPPRIIATASAMLETHVREEAFRPDLFFRLAVLVLNIPPLRNRKEDIPLLLHRFLLQHAKDGNSAPQLTPKQHKQLHQYHWPGNIRELANLAERASVLGNSAFDLPQSESPQSTRAARLPEGFNLAAHMEGVERNVLMQAIAQTHGDHTQMQRLLGLDRKALRDKLNKHKLLQK